MARSSGPQLPPVNQWADENAHPDYAQPGYGHDRGQHSAPPAFGQQVRQPPAPANAQVYAQQPPAQPYAPSGHPQQPQAEGYYYPDNGYAADSYSQSTLRPGSQGYQQPVDRGWAEPPAAAPAYAPQFEPYTPPRGQPAPRHSNDYAPPAYGQADLPTQPTGHGASRDPRLAAQQHQQPGWQSPPDLRGASYEDDPREAASRWGREGAPYAAPAAPPPPADYGAHHAPSAYAPPSQQGGGYQGGGYGAAPGWQGEPAYQGYDARQQHAEPAAYPPESYQPPYQQGGYPAADYGGQGYAPPDYAAGGYAQPYADVNPADPAATQAYPAPANAQSRELEAEYDPDEFDYEDEKRGGGRKMMIAAALVGAVVVSGGLAYGYLAYSGGNDGGGTPVVKSESQPSKFKPIDAGGKKFAHTDSKVLGRLNDGSSATETSGATNEDGSPRKVTTMIVGRDGSIVPSTGVSAPPPGSAAPAGSGPVVVTPPAASPVPGLTIVDGFGGRGGPVAPVASAPPQAAPTRVAPVNTAPPPVAAAPAKVQVISRADPRRADPVDADPEPQPQARQKPAERPVEKKPVRQAAVAAGSMTDAAPSSGGASGFVAVLASIPESGSSRIEALKQFADLQQRYPSQLRNKTPDVQSASVAGKGSYHRLVAGPPGSRQQANELCAELKAVGYTNCWIKAY